MRAHTPAALRRRADRYDREADACEASGWDTGTRERARAALLRAQANQLEHEAQEVPTP